ncbi:MAG TPA: hypothetical protein VMU45_12080 [Candidatus Eisenbacteria bacterium]|nr:hypothetical protein [Candidatus Eisenbacteria bacterium]
MAIREEVLANPLGHRCKSKLVLDNLPFSPGDVTAGSEDELQAVVMGNAAACDLPITIRDSRFLQNIAKRSSSGVASRSTYRELQEFLSDHEQVWENCWVRFLSRRLSPHALNTFLADLKIGERGQSKRHRADSVKFTFEQAGETWLRVPISYALKLALADLAGTQPHMPERMQREAKRLLRYFSNDNTSPETTSFHVVSSTEETLVGEAVARESARRFLFSSLLMSWANLRFGLLESGQRALVYHAPHPPVRQTELSSCISDSFYRELFMSPCLSGWDDGEAKADYMHLCHQVLSRSQLNSVAKLREAGIISNNLIVLPSLSNVSLANNGIHITMGSRALTRVIAHHGDEDEAHREEKRLGDLVIKVYEHFLALFVGTYSAAPYRIDFAEFHPEKLLAFLPHELDFTHLRLMWREWREKAKMRVLGRAVTPYGPLGIDNFRARIFGLRGDLVPDYRLLNYPVAWLATERASALDGKPGNVSRLVEELDELGIVDRRLSFYMPVRLREFGRMGFSGFEGRYYSLFPGFVRDMAPAGDLQQLLLMAAYQLALDGTVQAEDIPDDPTSESERRQPFFFAAAGLPAFYVHKKSRNALLRQILSHCKKTRSSWRHPEYLRVSIRDYREALVGWLEANARETIELASAKLNLVELRFRLADKSQQAHRRVMDGVLAEVGSSDPMRLRAREFNRVAEQHYRETLRQANLSEAFEQLREDTVAMAKSEHAEMTTMVRYGVRVQEPVRFLDSIGERLVNDDLTAPEVATVLNLLLLLSTLKTEEGAPCRA